MTPELINKMKRTHWYRTRPKVIQEAMLIWPPDTTVLIHDQKRFLIGYTETDGDDPYDVMLMLSKIDPVENYEEARKEENIIRICGKHLRKTN